jgi:uncharacterized protein GlcG (DUF336 family)
LRVAERRLYLPRWLKQTTIFAGVPLKKVGKVVWGIGVSGGSSEQDHAVAEAGVAAF